VLENSDFEHRNSPSQGGTFRGCAAFSSRVNRWIEAKSVDADAVVVGLGVAGEEVAGRLAEGRRIPGMAGTSVVTPDWAPVARRIRDEATDSWDDTVAVERFEGKGGRFVRGWARVTGPTTVEVKGQECTARRALCCPPASAPSSRPRSRRSRSGRTGTPLRPRPSSLLVIGGGAIGLEIGQAMARFGTHVTVVEQAEHLVGPEEPEASELVTEVLRREGIEIHTGSGSRASSPSAPPGPPCIWRAVPT
jgi:pyruvate/2-oxoglutarate dehydrogenase complex dihydrolipoamide dehydrogenase (E3) component